MKKDLFYFSVIAVLAVLLFFSFQCRGKVKCPEYVTKFITVIDTFEVEKPVVITETRPQPGQKFTVHDTIELKVPIPGEKVDTLAILEQFGILIDDWATKRFYDTSFNTKYGVVRVRDSVQFNRLIHRNLAIGLSIPEKVTTVRKGMLLAGVRFGTRGVPEPLASFGIETEYVGKRGRAYSLGASIVKDKGIVYEFGFKTPLIK